MEISEEMYAAAIVRAVKAEEQAASGKLVLEWIREGLGMKAGDSLQETIGSLKASVAAFCAEVRLSDVRGECGHPLMTTRSAPRAWAPTGDVRYLPCAICEVERLKSEVAAFAVAAEQHGPDGLAKPIDRLRTAEASLEAARGDPEDLGTVVRDLRDALARVGKALDGVKTTEAGGRTGDPYVDRINALRKSDEWCRAQLGAQDNETTCMATLRMDQELHRCATQNQLLRRADGWRTQALDAGWVPAPSGRDFCGAMRMSDPAPDYDRLAPAAQATYERRAENLVATLRARAVDPATR